MTIETKDPSKQDLIGQRRGLSAQDIEEINEFYFGSLTHLIVDVPQLAKLITEEQLPVLFPASNVSPGQTIHTLMNVPLRTTLPLVLYPAIAVIRMVDLVPGATKRPKHPLGTLCCRDM